MLKEIQSANMALAKVFTEKTQSRSPGSITSVPVTQRLPLDVARTGFHYRYAAEPKSFEHPRFAIEARCSAGTVTQCGTV